MHLHASSTPLMQNLDDAFAREIKEMTDDMENHCFCLSLEDNKDNEKLYEFSKKSKCHNNRLNDSIILSNALNACSDNSRMANIVEIAKRSCTFIKDDIDDKFYKLQERWKDLNKIMEDNNRIYLAPFLSQKGLTQRKLMQSSLYLFLEVENVQKLDSVWEEYKEGTLTKEFRQQLFPDANFEFSISIAEDNYKQYRIFLCTNAKLNSCVL